MWKKVLFLSVFYILNNLTILLIIFLDEVVVSKLVEQLKEQYGNAKNQPVLNFEEWETVFYDAGLQLYFDAKKKQYSNTKVLRNTISLCLAADIYNLSRLNIYLRRFVPDCVTYAKVNGASQVVRKKKK